MEKVVTEQILEGTWWEGMLEGQQREMIGLMMGLAKGRFMERDGIKQNK